IAFAKDWYPASRLQNAPSWHYVNTDQWRYEKSYLDYHVVPEKQPEGSLVEEHTMDVQVRAVRNGWLPFYPQFTKSSLELAKEAKRAGCKTPQEISDWVVAGLKDRKIRFAVEDPDAEECWPRIFFMWRGNALMSSAKGHEYFLKHYLGTHNNTIAEEVAEGHVTEVDWRKIAPQGKLDLVVDLNFRMDTSALYSDIVLPAATWYEKADLNSTDMHSFIHPLSEAVPPCWESKSDWDIFRAIAKKFTEFSKKHFPEPVTDIVTSALAHDSPAEVAQPVIKDWFRGECEAIPGKTMPGIAVMERDYRNVYEKYIALGPGARTKLGAHGTSYDPSDFYDELKRTGRRKVVDGQEYPSLENAVEVCDAILKLATVSNGELAHRSYKNLEERVGLSLADLADGNRSVRMSYKDLQSQPRRLINSPMWSGLTDHGRTYSPFTYQVERLVPWRTLTGRQHLYLDHDAYIQFGEHVPTYKPKPNAHQYADMDASEKTGENKGAVKMLNFLTPHGKWHIHSTYGDNARMTTLSRGCEPFWINEKDAEELGIVDNEWVEVFNDHGVVVTRANVSCRIPKGICIIYHSPERT
ncbi:MAG: nitrate reductase subunit alpha, partial [Planctomycetes bacterium]|nr:nitrate reductase subunit alpha [Planctomycetota bacterium]